MKNFKPKNLLSVLFLFCLLATTLVSCKSTGVVPPTTIETTTTTTIKEVVRDTIFEIQKDSSYYKAYLECVDGKVVISPKVKTQSKKGDYLKPPSVNIKDNIIEVNCEAEAQKLFAQWKDVYIKEHQDKIEKTPYPVEKQLSWWQTTQIWCGRLFLLILLIFIVASGYRTYKNI